MVTVAHMALAPRTTIALPTADRRAAHAFLRDGLGLAIPGEPADDGVPEPLRAALGAGAEVMMVPTDGFAMVIERRVEQHGGGECLISLTLDSAAEVDALFAQAVGAGGTAAVAPASTPWGLYRALVADPDDHLWQLSSPALGGEAR